MMIRHVTVTYNRTLNLGNGNYAKVGVELFGSTEEREDAVEGVRDLFLLAKAMTREQAMPMIRKFQEQMERLVATLPEEDRGKFAHLFAEPNLELALGLNVKGEDDADQDA